MIFACAIAGREISRSGNPSGAANGITLAGRAEAAGAKIACSNRPQKEEGRSFLRNIRKHPETILAVLGSFGFAAGKYSAQSEYICITK